MRFVIARACPGVRKKTGAYIAAGVACFQVLALVIQTLLGMIFTYREALNKPDRRTNAEREAVQCYYGAGFALWGCWILFNMLLFAGITTENKRAIGMWLCFVLLLPLYLVAGMIYFLVTKNTTPWEIAYLVALAVHIVILIWLYLAVWVYFGDVRNRDKNPELRENEMMLTNPLGVMMMPVAGTYNPSYGAQGGGSMNSIPRSHRSRHTYAPTETESVRTAPSMPRQSRLDQYRANQTEKSSIISDKGPEREGGTTYYRYDYNASTQQEAKYQSQYQPARHEPPQYQPTRQYQGSQGSLNGAGARRTGGSQGSLSGVGVRYQPTARHTPPPTQQLTDSQSQIHKDSEV